MRKRLQQRGSARAQNYLRWLVGVGLLALLVPLWASDSAIGADLTMTDFKVAVDPGQNSEGQRNATITFHQNGEIAWYTTQCRIFKDGTDYAYAEPCLDSSSNGRISALLYPGNYKLEIGYYRTDPSMPCSLPTGCGIGRTLDLEIPGAAEIPPTQECQATFKSLFKDFVRGDGTKPSYREERARERALAEDLEAAGCISDASAMFSKDPPTPKSPECVEGAKSAAALWKVDGGKINALYQEDWKQTKVILIRVTRIEQRMLALKRKGGEARKVKRLDRKTDALLHGLQQKENVASRKAMKIVGDKAASNVLTYLELMSRGCVDSDYSSDDKPAGPADRVVRKQMSLIFTSISRLFRLYGAAGGPPASYRLSSVLPSAG